MKLLLTTFITIFIAELGDKTQIATMLFASNKESSKTLVFFGAAAALVCATAIGVLAGSYISTIISEKTLKVLAGSGFVLIGIWTIASR